MDYLYLCRFTRYCPPPFLLAKQSCMEILIPWKDLEPVTLESLLGEIVSRDGTDYGASELTVQEKIRQARDKLESGTALLCWNSISESASLKQKDEIGDETLEQWLENSSTS